MASAGDQVTLEIFDFIIVGGGIAGTTCAQRLSALVADAEVELAKKIRILVLSSSQMVKIVTNVKQVTKFLNEFDVEEKSANQFVDTRTNLTILHKTVADLDSKNNVVICEDGSRYEYGRLCVCTGGIPKLISNQSRHVIGIRDTETVANFQSKLSTARQIMIVGNGGIATELAYEIEHCKIIWAVKDSHISHIFFDPHVAKFFENIIEKNRLDENEKLPAKRSKYTITKIEMNEKAKDVLGPGLGPDWAANFPTKGQHEQKRNIQIEYKCEVKRILERKEYLKEFKGSEEKEEWPVYAELTNGKIFGCDFIISATGVAPATHIFTKNNKFDLAEDGGFKVNDKLQTSVENIYAAGDNCTASWDLAPHWFQMRLWSQASQMADYAARSMWASYNGQPIQLDFCFELFAHITKFFNFKVILLGNYDARGLGNDYELLLRCTEGVEYVKVVLQNGRVQGVLLIGETDLEETFENLILNQIDVSAHGEDLINPDIDIEDYFD